MRRYALLALTASLLVHPIKMLAQQNLSIGMKMTKTTVMLGEPVWVDVAVTNRSGETIRLDFGNECYGNNPLKVQIPNAEAIVKPATRCGAGVAGSCPTGALPSLADGETMTRRYVLAGDFRIVRPGSYDVLMEKTIRYAPVSAGTSELNLAPSSTNQQTAKQKDTLLVGPADPAKLLALEETIAQAAMERPVEAPSLTNSIDGKLLDRASLREQSHLRQQASSETTLFRYSTAEGLAAYPVAGMERIFRSWMGSGTFDTYGLWGLKRLNTPTARDQLAEMAASQEQLQNSWVQSFRFQAIDALAELGDTTYVPLVERLLGDPSHEVQRAAVRALGLLGGKDAVPLLAARARTRPTKYDRSEAITAMGNTASLTAVPMLLEFADMPDADEPSASFYALNRLTHLGFPNPLGRSAADVKSEWTQFWMAHQANARAYGPYDCGDMVHLPGVMQ